jgi:hypothetical protein
MKTRHLGRARVSAFVLGWLALAFATTGRAGPLDPRHFASLGSLVQDDGYAFVHGNTLDLYAEDNGPIVASYEGVDYHGITVFTFNAVDVGPIFFRGQLYDPSGPYDLQRPFALLSKGGLKVGDMNVSGGFVQGSMLDESDFALAGPGGGAGGYVDFGTFRPTGQGSDALGLERAGDGGGPGVFHWAAVEAAPWNWGRLGTVAVVGTIAANGGVGESSSYGTAGSGGGGGGILLHGAAVLLAGARLEANGGDGGIDFVAGYNPQNYGRGGRGGRIRILYGDGGFAPGPMSVTGGRDFYPGQPDGPNGWIRISYVPEPSGLGLLAAGTVAMLWRARRRRADRRGGRVPVRVRI